MSVQKAIFPGLLAGIALLFGMISLLSGARSVNTAREQQQVAQSEPVAEAQLSEAPVVAPYDGSCTVSQRYPDSVLQWCELIEINSRNNGLDPNLISAMMLQESNGQPDAYSKSGAVGLMQVMPRDGLASKFMCVNGPCFSDRPSMEELFDPEYNVAYGTRMLAELVQHYGDVRTALKAYGPKDVGFYYADLVLGIARRNQ